MSLVPVEMGMSNITGRAALSIQDVVELVDMCSKDALCQPLFLIVTWSRLKPNIPSATSMRNLVQAPQVLHSCANLKLSYCHPSGQAAYQYHVYHHRLRIAVQSLFEYRSGSRGYGYLSNSVGVRVMLRGSA